MRRRLALPALLTVLALVAAGVQRGGDDGDARRAFDELLAAGDT